MEISVVIPVYNAEPFIKNAVESAIKQREAGEVLLIEDASSDNSFAVCQELERKHEKVRLIKHRDCKNHGAGASRNLGIKSAQYPYIAFLDADDFYLDNRFKQADSLFKIMKNIDGVYEAVGISFYSESGKKRWLELKSDNLTTINKKLKPNKLAKELIIGKKGSLHLDGIVIKRSLLMKCGMFSEELEVHQDTELIIKLAELGRLVPGNLENPVAVRGIHNNRILRNKNKNYSKRLVWKNLAYWGYNNSLRRYKFILLLKNYFYYEFLITFKKKTDTENNSRKFRLLILELKKFHLYSMAAIFLISFSILKYHLIDLLRKHQYGLK